MAHRIIIFFVSRDIAGGLRFGRAVYPGYLRLMI